VDPKNVQLIMRVHYGIRQWRLPVVRTEDLYWADGLVQRARGRTLARLGGEVLWDERAGGQDDAYADAAVNSANAGDIWGGGSAASASAGPAPVQGSWSADRPTPFGGTQDFHLLVVDCFDYEELKDKGKGAKRIWTTFMSAPHRGKQKFSQVAEALARNGVSFFGETSAGLQVFTDARARVELGPLKVIEDEESGEVTPNE
jgi:hypothetical protein